MLLHLPNALHDIQAVVNHYQNQGHAGYEGDTNWLYYIQAMAEENIAVVVVGLAGVGWLLWRRRAVDLTLLAFAPVAYLQLATYKVNFTRNLMPLIPFLCLFAAVLLVEGGAVLIRRRPALRYVLVGLAAVLVALPAVAVARNAALNAQPTTRVLAQNWLEHNAAAGAKIWIEPVSVELLPRTGYRVEGGRSVSDHPPAWYAANGYNYIVTSDATDQPIMQGGKPQAQTFYHNLQSGVVPAPLRIVQTITPDHTAHPGTRISVIATGLSVVGQTLADVQGESAAIAPVDLGGLVRLVGLHLPRSAKVGTAAPILLYWQSQQHTPHDYTVFLHLLNAQGQTVSQSDIQPLGGTRPTSLWQPGDVLRDEYPLPLPANLPPDVYTLHAGLYLAADGSRLALPDGSTEVALGTLTVSR